MKRFSLLVAAALFSLNTMAQVPDVAGAAKAGVVEEAMKDSVVEPGREETGNKADEPMKRTPMIIFTSAVVVIIIAVAARRRKKNG